MQMWGLETKPRILRKRQKLNTGRTVIAAEVRAFADVLVRLHFCEAMDFYSSDALSVVCGAIQHPKSI